MKRFAIALVAVGILALPTSASARSVDWVGTHGTPGVYDYFGIPFETLQLRTSGGRVWIKTLQVVLACTDTADGSVNPVAFTVYNSPVRDTLSRNRYVIDLSAVSTGRLAAVHVRGTLGSNGRGSARIRLLGNSTDPDTGQRLEECEREVTINLRRGPR
ncbi:MAG: hypothetical protein WCJ50_09620 [Actinomycetes bacterium]